MKLLSASFLSITLVTLLTLHTPASAERVLDVTGSLAGGASNRDNDAVGTATLRGHYGFNHTFGLNVSLIAGAGENDERTIGAFAVMGSIGKTLGRLRPKLRLGFIHQHETARMDAEANPITVTLGVDDAIRHRTGALAEVGTTIDITSVPRGVLFANADISTQVMFDNNGPRSYVLFGLGIGYRYGK